MKNMESNPELIVFKQEIADQIKIKMIESKESQDFFAKTIGITQPQLSQIINQRLTKFTVDFLIKIAKKCGLNVVFKIK